MTLVFVKLISVPSHVFRTPEVTETAEANKTLWRLHEILRETAKIHSSLLKNCFPVAQLTELPLFVLSSLVSTQREKTGFERMADRDLRAGESLPKAH